jgi:hypothetical protein
MLEEGKFDSKLKGALEHLQVPYDASSWDRLEQRLSQLPGAEPKDPAMDQHFRTVLQGLEANYNAAHWDMMAARIVQEQRLRRRIWITKFAEAAIFLLLVANLDGLLGGIQQDSNGNRQNLGTGVPVAEAGLKKHSSKTGITQGGTKENSLPQETSGFWAPIDQSSTGGQNNETVSQSDLNAVALVPSVFNDGTVTSGSVSMPTLPLNTDAAALSVLDPLPLLQQNAISETFAFVGLPVGVHQKVAKHSNFYAMAFLGANQNQIHNGNDMRKKNGSEAGLALGFRGNKWGVEAGIAYSKKTFQPKRKIEINAGNVTSGYYGTYVNQVNADVVSIPVHVTRKVGKMGRTVIHAIAGSTANFAVRKSFDYKTVYYPSLSQSSDPNNPGNKPTAQKDSRGVFQHGTVSENFYASVDAGIRVEHSFKKNFSVFLEPMMQTTFTKNGIGPDASKINTFSVRAGVIAAL